LKDRIHRDEPVLGPLRWSVGICHGLVALHKCGQHVCLTTIVRWTDDIGEHTWCLWKALFQVMFHLSQVHPLTPDLPLRVLSPEIFETPIAHIAHQIACPTQSAIATVDRGKYIPVPSWMGNECL
jgi:hypothetical protein